MLWTTFFRSLMACVNNGKQWVAETGHIQRREHRLKDLACNRGARLQLAKITGATNRSWCSKTPDSWSFIFGPSNCRVDFHRLESVSSCMWTSLSMGDFRTFIHLHSFIEVCGLLNPSGCFGLGRAPEPRVLCKPQVPLSSVLWGIAARNPKKTFPRQLCKPCRRPFIPAACSKRLTIQLRFW